MHTDRCMFSLAILKLVNRTARVVLRHLFVYIWRPVTICLHLQTNKKYFLRETENEEVNFKKFRRVLGKVTTTMLIIVDIHKYRTTNYQINLISKSSYAT